MWLLVKHAWPVQLEERAGESKSGREEEGGTNILSPFPPLPLSRSSTLHSQPENPEDPQL